MSGQPNQYISFGYCELRFEPIKGTTTQFQLYRKEQHIRGFETPQQAIAYLQYFISITFNSKKMEDYKDLDFGSYCTIEMFRHGADNEFYQHKVIGRLKSNAAVSVPIKYGIGATGHEEIIGKEVVPCLKVVCCGIDERRIFKVRVSDVIPA